MGLDVSVRATGIAVVGLDYVKPLPEGVPPPFYAEVSGYGLPATAPFEDVHTRLATIRKRVVAIAREFSPELVAIEDIVFANEGSAKAQIWGMNLLIQHTIFRLGIPCRMVPLDTWRSWLGVSWQALKKKHPDVDGSARSRLIKAAVRQRLKIKFGVEFEADEHNQAEAYAIAQFARHRAEHPDDVQTGLGIEISARRRRKL